MKQPPVISKIPPQAIDCEEAVLGIIMLYPESINEVISVLTSEMFYKAAHHVIFKNAIDTYKSIGSVDLITLSERLRNNNELDVIGGPVYLSQLMGKIYSDSQISYYAAIIKQKYLRRELIRHSYQLQTISFDEAFELAEVIEYAESDLYKITDHSHTTEPVKLGKILNTLLIKIQKIINHEIKLIGLPSGFIDLDRMKGGFIDGEFIIIAARPSMGKSAVALQVALNNGYLGNGVALFSVEMSAESLAQRSLSGVSDKTNVELMQGRCNLDTIVNQCEPLFDLPLYIDDTSGITITELRSKTRKLKQKHNIKLLIVDYLQLMHGDGETREQVVSTISRGLKGIAKDLNIPVIALSQLNRSTEKRADNIPILSDLRESGSLEQDADVVIFLNRPVKNGLRSVYIDGTEHDSTDLMQLIVAKNRNGAVGEFYLKHNVSMTKFTDINDDPNF